MFGAEQPLHSGEDRAERRQKQAAKPQRIRGRRESDKLQAGDVAPDFELKRLETQGKKSAPADDARTVRLSSFRGKQPVVLIFGSYT